MRLNGERITICAFLQVLSELALRYLLPPPISVPSERLFSTAGDIYDVKQNQLDSEREETLLFIKSNIEYEIKQQLCIKKY